jgi:hypothetical protein
MKKLHTNKIITFIFNTFLLIFYTSTVFGVVVPEDVEKTLVKVTKIYGGIWDGLDD